MMEAARTSETSVDNHFTRQYNPEDSSEQKETLFFSVHRKQFMALYLYLMSSWTTREPRSCFEG
jgi:hypothetical protein